MTIMNRFIHMRGKIRSHINSNVRIDRFLHSYITVILGVNTILILYAMLSVTVRMSLGGVGILDSMPIELYILPLMIFLPLMIKSYYQTRTALWSFFILLVASVFFSMLSLLVHGFIICVIFNIVAVASIFILGRFRLKGSLRSAGKKSIAYFLLMNLLGLTFPISIVVMGQVPITEVSNNSDANMILSVPLADFEFPYSNVTPTTDIISSLISNQFGVNLRVLEDNAASWQRLGDWLIALNTSGIPYTISLSANRVLFVGSEPVTLGTTSVLQQVFQSHRDALSQLVVEMENISSSPQNVLFDMTLSAPEWQKLMFHTRSLDLVGFTGLMRASIYSTDISTIDQESALLAQQADSAGFSAGVIIESFVIDDLQDYDNVAMRLSGVSISSLDLWDVIEVSCERSRFSIEMNGDVGEYLVESYSESLGALGSSYCMRIGEAGNVTDIQGRSEVVYDTLSTLCEDIIIATGNGVVNLSINSLPSLLSSFGPTALSDLRGLLATIATAAVTYTFRIYAYRAVFIAIDSFDILML
ncbi:MAG: hypothetical protein E4H14_09865 [Candidatus Thorarchaeota archaeon]|nr:MAG: hypothetical protein E4H14_09865 [Candidatus Thorarchaeota archaeon]